MKFYLILGVFCFNLTLFAQDLRFFNALGQIESNNNPKAHNLKEDARGIYQIREKYFLDAQNFNQNLKKYTHNDCFNEQISKKVVIAYMSRYCKNGSNEDMARTHNSGPNWRNKKHLTENYVNKFRKALRDKIYWRSLNEKAHIYWDSNSFYLPDGTLVFYFESEQEKAVNFLKARAV